jgi:hypothetical protein
MGDVTKEGWIGKKGEDVLTLFIVRGGLAREVRVRYW